MKKNRNLDLSAVIPVGNLENDYKNIFNMLKQSDDYGVEVILVVDDQPNELIRSLEAELISQEITFKLIEGFWKNPGSARNAGFSLCTRTFVAFWDSDDEPILKNISALLNEKASSDSDAILGRYQIQGSEQLTLECSFSTEKSLEDFTPRILSNPGLWRFIFKREYIKNLAFPACSAAEDQLFLQRFFAGNPRIRISNQIVYTYIQGGGFQLTKSNRVAEETLVATKIGVNEQISSTSPYQNLVEALIIKQLFSVLKHGSSKHLMQAFSLFSDLRKKIGILRFSKVTILFLQAKLNSRNRKRPKVEIEIMGGLGNQLFQLAFGIYLSAQLGKPVHLSDISRNIRRSVNGKPELALYNETLPLDCQNHYPARKLLDRGLSLLLRLNLGENKRKVNRDMIPRWILNTFLSLVSFYPRRIFIAGNVGYVKWEPGRFGHFIVGYFQSFKYLEHPSVLPLMKSLSPRSTEDEVNDFKDLSEKELPLLVHVRQGDYRSEPDFGVVPTKYYQNAVKQQMQFGAYKSIWLFSDEQLDCKIYIPVEYQNIVRVIYSVGTNSVSLLEVMRMCQGYVIGNSTLSWWAASLSFAENPKVIYPDPWFSNLETPKDLIPPHWYPISRN